MEIGSIIKNGKRVSIEYPSLKMEKRSNSQLEKEDPSLKMEKEDL